MKLKINEIEKYDNTFNNIHFKICKGIILRNTYWRTSLLEK